MRRAIGVMALCSALLVAGSAHAAQAMQHYQNPALHYAVTYPTSWSRIGVPGADFAAVSANRNAFVSVAATSGKANAVQVQRALAGAFTEFGHPLGGPSYRPFRIQGATGTLAQDRVAAPNGKTSLVLAFMLSRHGLIYFALGVVRDANPRTSMDVAAALAFVSDTAIV
ncbi:MAG TPA: hypothetical protein VHB98_15445 [Chloroflexota bacterium]|nr:hypothetical protein [Chloroflexota bacterium]